MNNRKSVSFALIAAALLAGCKPGSSQNPVEATLTPVRTPVWYSGLLQGKLPCCELDFSVDVIDNSCIPVEVVPGSVMAEIQADTNNHGARKYINPYTGTEYIWNWSRTVYGYTGQIRLEKGQELNIAKNIDDGGYVAIDGKPVLSDGTWNSFPVATFKAPSSKWYTIDLRASDTIGGKGPGNGGIAPLGLAYNINGAKEQKPSGWRPFRDEKHDGSFLRTTFPGISYLRMSGASFTDTGFSVRLGAARLPAAASLRVYRGSVDCGDDPARWPAFTELARLNAGENEPVEYSVVDLSPSELVRFALVVPGSDCVQGFYQFSPCIAPASSAVPAQSDPQPVKKPAFAVRPRSEGTLSGDGSIFLRDGEAIAFTGDGITRYGTASLGFASFVLRGFELAGVHDLDKHHYGLDKQSSAVIRDRINWTLSNPEVKTVALMCGVNDVPENAADIPSATASYIANVRAMLDAAAASNRVVVLMTPTPVSDDPESDGNRAIRAFGAKVIAEAKARGLRCADCGGAMLAAIEALPPEERHGRYTLDGMRPSRDGHKLIAVELMRALGVDESLFPEILKAWNSLCIVPPGRKGPTPLRPEWIEARKQLLDGVKAIDCGGQPGPVACVGTNAFPLFTASFSDGSRCLVGAGAVSGDGRAIYLSHAGFLCPDDGTVDNRRFIRNAIAWLAKDKPSPRVGILGNGLVPDLLKQVGVPFEKLADDADLTGFDVLLSNDISDKTAPRIREFVENGGGFLGAGLGWGWRFFQKDKFGATISAKYPDNRAIAWMGLVSTDGWVNQYDRPYRVADLIPRGTLPDDAMDIALSDDWVDPVVRRQTSITLSLLANALPLADQPEFAAKLEKLARHPRANIVPSRETPIRITDFRARVAAIARQNAWRADPVRVWPADPAHKTFPGAVKPGWKPIDREIEVDGAVPRWHSTGVFAPAGEPLTVKLPAGAETKGLWLRIGSGSDDLTFVSGAAVPLYRAPLISMTVPLDKPETTLSSPFGGLVYIVVPDGGIAGWKGTVTLSGGIMSPWFKLGRDTNEDFARQCAETHAPRAEIESDSYISTINTDVAAKVADPEYVAKFWHRVLEADRKLVGWQPRTSPERVCSDAQISIGSLHNGYPMMYYVDSAANGIDGVVDKAALEEGNVWGFVHEIGHNHQNHAWIPDGYVEVTVNIFSAFAIDKVCGKPYRSKYTPLYPEIHDKSIEAFRNGPRTYAKLKENVILALEPYLRVAETYGWGVFHETFIAYYRPGFPRPNNDTEKWDVFLRELSAAAKADIASAFAAWGVPVSKSVLDECSAKYPKADPKLLP